MAKTKKQRPFVYLSELQEICKNHSACCADNEAGSCRKDSVGIVLNRARKIAKERGKK